jgi:hypothetical protein
VQKRKKIFQKMNDGKYSPEFLQHEVNKLIALAADPREIREAINN